MQNRRLLPISGFRIVAAIVLTASCFRPVCAAGGPAPALITNPAPSPTTTPTPNPCVVKAASALLITWQTGSHDANVCEPDGDTERALATPAAVSTAGSLTAGSAALRGDDAGIAVTFRASKTTDFNPVRKRSGFESLHGEDRFVVEVRALDASGASNDTLLRVSANKNGACRVEGSYTEDLHDACSVTTAPQKNDVATPRAPKGPTGCLPGDTADDKKVFCGAVVAKFVVVQPALNVPTVIEQRTQEVQVCTGFADRDVTTAELVCKKRQLTYAGDTAPHVSFQSSAGSSTGGSGSAAGDSASTAAAERRRALAAGVSPSATPDQGTQAGVGKGLVYDVHAAFPVGTGARASVALDRLNVSSLVERLQANLGAASSSGLLQNALTQSASKLIPTDQCGKKCPEDSFKKLDASVFDLVINPFRTGVATKFADAEVDLKPVDFSTVTNVNYGAKVVATPHNARVGLAWYRDIDNGATGSAVHADGDFGPSLSFGVTHMVANMDPAKDSNVYRVDKAHTANTVLGAAFRFGGGRSLQLFQRYGELSRAGQRDRLSVLTWSPSDIVKPFDDAGTSWHPFAGIGYRSIDANYDPLGTKYDQFTGTHSVFATVGYGRFPAKDGSDADLQAAVTGVRAWDAVQPRYNAVVASLTAKLWGADKAPALVLSHTRSNIAASVYARGDASVLVQDTDEGRTLLHNDNDTAKIAYSNGGWSYSAGPSWTNSPKQCDAKLTPHCQANKNRQLAYDVHTTDVASPLFLKFSMDLAPQEQVAFAQKTVAASQLDAKAVLRYSKWCAPNGLRVQPAMTYDSNISQSDSAYVPGRLFEAGIDIGSGKIGKAVLRVSYKLIHPQNGTDAALAQHALFVGIASDNASEAFFNRCAKTVKP